MERALYNPAEIAPAPRLAALVAAEGSGTSDFVRALARPGAVARDLADAAHFICLLHGRKPGVVGQAIARIDPAPEWLMIAGDAFAAERSHLARLVAAAGPVPSTPGHAEAEAAVAGQRHAIETLACSDRIGCAMGAAAALLLDWAVIRRVLDVAAVRFGVEPIPGPLPLDAVRSADFGAHQRAAMFAADQLLTQHRGLWRLLEARAAARG